MGFGFGRHSCPGRFFAANEVKIALCHILLKYDFKLAEAERPEHERVGVFNIILVLEYSVYAAALTNQILLLV